MMNAPCLDYATLTSTNTFIELIIFVQIRSILKERPEVRPERPTPRNLSNHAIHKKSTGDGGER